MTMRMPRGAMPTPRSQLAASEPYRPDAGSGIFIPSGAFPTPNQDLAAAQPYRPAGATPESYLAWPVQFDSWSNQRSIDSIWAEEAFAKACVEPREKIPAAIVVSAAQRCGTSNFSEFMQTHGFEINARAYLDGPFLAVDWTNTAVLNNAIAQVGPVKIGIAAASLAAGPHGHVTPGKSGWTLHELPPGQPGETCASLCGFGSLPTLFDLFKSRGVDIVLPPGVPTGLCYAMFLSNSIGIIDMQSLLNITGEAWVRNPTTIVRNLHH
jgi:hypothetical protein